MKEPKRLLSQGATDFERQLLRAVVNERPSALLRSRMQRGLGLVGPLAWASTVKAMLGGAAGKITGLVALGVLTAAGFTALTLVPGDDSEVAPAPATSVTSPASDTAPEPRMATPAIEPAAVETPPSAPSSAERPAVAEAAPPAADAVSAVTPTSEADEDDRRLREEIALLDAARSALERGDRAAARSSLRTYRERFPSGVLAREANVLRRRAEPARAKR
jgi:hypothetical protein